MKFLMIIFMVMMFWNNCYADEISDLIPFIIAIESNGNPNAVSEDGCIGLMQISPIVLREFEIHNPIYENGNYIHLNAKWMNKKLFEPQFNIDVGTWYLRRLRDHYLKDNYTIERMLAAYNGGPTRMRRLLRQGKDWQDMPRESINYVKKVMKLYKQSTDK